MNTKLLRQKILDLAIRGKLTEQKKSDGTTKDLLVSIVANVIASEAKQSKKSKPAEPKTIIPLNKDEAPFEIPENWEWVRLGDVASDFQYGSSEKSEPEGKVAVLRMSNINRMGQVVYDDLVYTSTESEIAKYTLDVGDVLFNRTNSPEWVGKTALYRGDIPAIYAGYIIRIKPKFLPEYLNYLMCSKYERDWAYEVKTDGVHQSNINAQKLMAFTVPLPPLAEQKRIVEAIENAFAEITEIENNQELLKKHIKQGRQKILDLAIRGRLTQQLKTDGTTADLLAQIQDERRETNDESDAGKKGFSNVIASATSTSSRTPIRDPFAASKNSDNVIASTAKQSKKFKPAEPKTIIPLNKNEAPFEIPETWEWVRLGDVCDKLIDGDHNPPKGISKQTEYLMLSSRNVNDNKVVDLENVRYLTKEMFEEENKRTNLIEGDILFTSVGSLGRSCVYDGNGNFCFQRSVTIVHTLIFNKYLKYFFDSDYYQKVIVENATGTAQLGFYLEQMRKSLVAIPPLAEQQRIVAAIEQAFTEFDAMEKL